MNPLEQQFNMFGEFQRAVNEALRPDEPDEEDIKLAEECERDKTAWFETTRGVSKKKIYE